MIDLSKVGREPTTIRLHGQDFQIGILNRRHAHQIQRFVRRHLKENIGDAQREQDFVNSPKYVAYLLWLLIREVEPDVTYRAILRWYEEEPAFPIVEHIDSLTAKAELYAQEANLLRSALVNSVEVMTRAGEFMQKPLSDQLLDFVDKIKSILDRPDIGFLALSEKTYLASQCNWHLACANRFRSVLHQIQDDLNRGALNEAMSRIRVALTE